MMLNLLEYAGTAVHEQGAKIEYGLDWKKPMPKEDILTSIWESDNPALTIVSSSFNTTTKVTGVIVEGGLEGQTYVITNTITTLNYRDSRSIKLICPIR